MRFFYIDCLLRLRSPVLSFCLLDSSLSLCARPEPPANVMVPAKGSSSSTSRGPGSQDSVSDSSPSTPLGDQLVLVAGTEKCAAVFGLPSQRQMGGVTLAEAGTAVVASIVSWGGSRYTPLLLVFTSDGAIKGEMGVCLGLWAFSFVCP